MFFRRKPPAPQSAPSLPDLAGFFTAHAVYSISDGGPLIPLVGYTLPDGTTSLARFAPDDQTDLAVAVEQGRNWLKTNPAGARQAALVIDAFITLPIGKTDALIVEAVQFDPNAPGPSTFSIALPYRPNTDPRGFAIHRPKLAANEGPMPDLDTLFEAFFKGVERHEKGAKLWSDHLDESI